MTAYPLTSGLPGLGPPFGAPMAVGFASRRAAPEKRAIIGVSPIKIRAGRSEFCQYVARGSMSRIDFKNELLRAQAEEGVAAYVLTLSERQAAT